MKRMLALSFVAAVFATAVNAQFFGSNTTCGLTPGPCVERAVRRAYAPVDYMLNNYGYGYGYGGGYGYYGGRIGTSALIGAASGAIAGGLVSYAVSRHNGQPPERGEGQAYYTSASQGREIRWAEPKRQKPLDCRKPAGKRGKNETACAAAEAEAAAAENAARQEAERQALAASLWRLYNRSGFVVEVFDGKRKLGRMRPNQSWQVLEPTSGYRAVILAPDFSGQISEREARIRPANDFQGWVITSPRVEEVP